MTLTNWLRSVFSRPPKPNTSRHRTSGTVELYLVRLEDRRVLSASGGDTMLFSIGGTGATLPVVGQVQASDIVSYDGTQFAIVFDGSDVGLSGASIDGLAWKGDNQFLLSFATTTTIAGVGTFSGSDILQFDATSLGDVTSGTFSLFLRGSDLGLSGTAGNIDALDLLDDGSLIISTQGNVTLPANITFPPITLRAEDLLQITPDANGNYAQGTRALFFDGSDVGLNFSTEQVDAVAIDGNQIRLSTSGSFFIDGQGIGGSREDVLTFNATSLGDTTTGAYVGITFDGSQVLGFGFDLSALDFATLPNPNHLPTAQDVNATTAEDSPGLVQLLGDDGEADEVQPLSYQIIDGPDFGVVTDFDPVTGTFSYVPNANFSGTDEIIYLVQETAADGTVFTSELATVHLTVTSVNDAPVALDVDATADEDSSVSIQLLGLDVEADHPLTFRIVEGPGFGDVTDFDPQAGTLTYVPNANFAGIDQIIYVVEETDANGTVLTSGLATVHLTVAPVNDAPVVNIAQSQFTADYGMPVLIQGVSVSDLEAESGQTAVVVTLRMENGTFSFSDQASPVVVTGNGTSDVVLTGTVGDINALLAQGVTTQADSTFSGTTVVVVTIQDGVDPGSSLVASATVELTILDPPPPPPPPPPPEPQLSFEDQIQALVQSGQLNHNQGSVLLHVLKHPDKDHQIEKTIEKVERWVDQGKLDADVAEELVDRLEELLEDAQPGPPGQDRIGDNLFEQIGNGKLKLAIGKPK